MRVVVALVLIGAAALTGARAAPVAVRDAPAPGCVDARRVAEVVQSDAYTLGVRLADETRYRLDLGMQCPGIANEPGVRLVSPGGWVCGRGGPETVQAGARRCPVANVAAIDARTFSTLALKAQREHDPRTLDSVTVTGEKRRGFTGSPAYCLDVSQMRAWHEDGDGIVVDVSPRHSGGHRRYRVELGAGCQSLPSSNTLVLRSGVGLGRVCGFPGDQAFFQSELAASGMDGAFERPVSERGLATRIGCPVAQVYPIDERAP